MYKDSCLQLLPVIKSPSNAFFLFSNRSACCCAAGKHDNNDTRKPQPCTPSQTMCTLQRGSQQTSCTREHTCYTERYTTAAGIPDCMQLMQAAGPLTAQCQHDPHHVVENGNNNSHVHAAHHRAAAAAAARTATAGTLCCMQPKHATHHPASSTVPA